MYKAIKHTVLYNTTYDLPNRGIQNNDNIRVHRNNKIRKEHNKDLTDKGCA